MTAHAAARHKSLRAVPALAIASVTVLLGGIGAVVLDGDAVEWPDDLAPLARFVSNERDLAFRHAVPVDVLDAEAYSDRVRLAGDDLDDEDRRELARSAGELRALGLASGDVDLFEAGNQVVDAGTLAFYDAESERITIRADAAGPLTPGLRATLVHELTHALQHQHVDFDHVLGGGSDLGGRALLEGDALRVEHAWTDALGEGELEALVQERARVESDFDEGTAAVPEALVAIQSAPYLLGEGFVAALTADGGNDRIDRAQRERPPTEADLLDPSRYLRGSTPIELPAPEPTGGEVAVGEADAFGAVALLVVLAERIDPLAALEAVAGWGGDRYVSFERDGRACLRIAVAGVDDEAEAVLGDAIGRWADAMPGQAAHAVPAGDHPGIEACDPGPEVDMALTGRGGAALRVPALRSFVLADAMTVFDLAPATCMADAVLDGFTFEQLADPRLEAFQGDAYEGRISSAVASCR